MIRQILKWHPEVALRYLPIVSDIKTRLGNIKDLEILEVGSGSLGIAPYLGKKILGVDRRFDPPNSDLLKRLQGMAQDLPFVTSSFKAVLAVDVLEHLPKKDRASVIFEAIRVAKEVVYLNSPVGDRALDQDKSLHEIYQKTFRSSFKFLAEHLEYKLPKEEEILADIQNGARILGKQVEIKILEHENLSLRYFLMRGWITKNLLIDLFFRKVLLILLPLFVKMNFGLCYRQLFIIKINENRH